MSLDSHHPDDTRLAEIAPFSGGRSFDALWADFERDGYVVFDSVLDSATLDRVRSALQPHFDEQRFGRNNFEGLKSFRQYALLAKGDVFAELAVHPLPMAFVDRQFGLSAILSAFLAIELHPGETVQPWHCDDDHCRLPRPRPPFQLSAFWAVDETTVENGATQVLPGSHLWDETTSDLRAADAFSKTDLDAVDIDPQPRDDAVSVPLKAGSLMLAKGNLLHRGGANRSDGKRLILTPQYSPGWVRPLENMILSTPPETAAKLPQRARELIGYSIHPPFMGYVDGMHPQKALDKLIDASSRE